MIYEYECQACGEAHEIEHSIKDEPKKDCPSCGESKLKRLISLGGFKLKGKGWFKDGY